MRNFPLFLLACFITPVLCSTDLFAKIYNQPNVADMSVLKSYGFDQCLTDLESVLYILYVDVVDGATPENSKNETFVTTDFIQQSMSVCSPNFPQDELFKAATKNSKYNGICHPFDPLVKPELRDTCFNELRLILSDLKIKIPDIEIDDAVKGLQMESQKYWKKKDKKSMKEKNKIAKKLKKKAEKELEKSAKKLKKERADAEKAKKDLKKVQQDFKKKSKAGETDKTRTPEKGFQTFTTSMNNYHEHTHNANDDCPTAEKGFKLHWGHILHTVNYMAYEEINCDDITSTIDDYNVPEITLTDDCEDFTKSIMADDWDKPIPTTTDGGCNYTTMPIHHITQKDDPHIFQFKPQDTMGTITKDKHSTGSKLTGVPLNSGMVISSSTHFLMSKTTSSSFQSSSIPDNGTSMGDNPLRLNSTRQFIQFVDGTEISGVSRSIDKVPFPITVVMGIALLIPVFI